VLYGHSERSGVLYGNHIDFLMNECLNNFKSWYIATLEKLYPHRDAGFPILMVAFPLLERYLRKKAKLLPKDKLSELFYRELGQLFPALSDISKAKTFWQVYRNGLLHEVTLSRQSRGGRKKPIGWVSHDKPMISIEDGIFCVHPVDFTRKVVESIQNDFDTFEGLADSQSQLPKVKPCKTQSGRIILGTGTQD